MIENASEAVYDTDRNGSISLICCTKGSSKKNPFFPGSVAIHLRYVGHG
jgi:hypothetical protein